MQPARRTFLKWLAAGGVVAAGTTGWWVTSSKHRAARLLRRLAADARRTITPAPLQPTPDRWSDNQISLCWLGHSTVLLNFFGVRILTDPAFGARVGVSLGLGTVGPKRYIAPALQVDQLPPLDLVLLSHAHMDHLDLPSLRTLPPPTPVVTAKATRDLVSHTKLNEVTELAWNDRTTLRTKNGELSIQAFEVKHWGQRWPSEQPRGYNGYVLRREGRAVLFAGDTAFTPLFKDRKAAGPYEVAIMPIGAYRPWIWNHCTPEEAVRMSDFAGAKFIVPVHHQTFRLSEEPMNEPIERLKSALSTEPERLALQQIGESYVCPKT
jgi:L-ascorbate metabolism protein UlaG (beta-lactamase superfamily)